MHPSLLRLLLAGSLAAGLESSASWTATGNAEQYANLRGYIVGDVDGNGFNDVIGAAPDFGTEPFINQRGTMVTGKVYLYLSSADGVSRDPIWQLQGDSTLGTHFGATVVPVGDVNGDGFADVVIGAFGKVHLFEGGMPGGLNATPAWSLSSDDSNFGTIMAVADFNGDGRMDLAVSNAFKNPDTGQAAGEVQVFFGMAGGFSSTPGWAANGDNQGFDEADRVGQGAVFGASLATGDFNHDGFADLAVGAPGFMTEQGRMVGKAYVYYGSASGLLSSYGWSSIGDNAGGVQFGSALGAGDVNGDGSSDLIVGAPGFGENVSGKAYAFLGNPSGLYPQPSWTSRGENVYGSFGAAIAVGDVNGDGFGDCIISAHFFASDGKITVGKAYVFDGGAAGLASSPSWSSLGDDVQNGTFGNTLRTGDVDGDGVSDVAITAMTGSDTPWAAGKIFLFRGASVGSPPPPATPPPASSPPPATPPPSAGGDGGTSGGTGGGGGDGGRCGALGAEALVLATLLRRRRRSR